eukprot:CAMPEP_0178403152 /NCGR_PEP_ID=MMETSP0689_2-20121128/17220_1 /TAXON_ID=160604 /ORGANISM="Amphidinium massartii, Strain CS-259" /LENGTH=58 /DNA_ID=CAMNT_0020024095 /DNA_START=73 /DNA_END=249 /DNA_ORIENTATION=-
MTSAEPMRATSPSSVRTTLSSLTCMSLAISDAAYETAKVASDSSTRLPKRAKIIRLNM